MEKQESVMLCRYKMSFLECKEKCICVVLINAITLG